MVKLFQVADNWKNKNNSKQQNNSAIFYVIIIKYRKEL